MKITPNQELMINFCQVYGPIMWKGKKKKERGVNGSILRKKKMGRSSYDGFLIKRHYPPPPNKKSKPYMHYFFLFKGVINQINNPKI